MDARKVVTFREQREVAHVYPSNENIVSATTLSSCPPVLIPRAQNVVIYRRRVMLARRVID